MVTETYNTFGNNAVDLFFERLLAKNIHGTVKSNVDAALSIASIEKIKVNLYPNPVEDLLFIDSIIDIKRIEIYNQLGQLVLQKETKLNFINLTNLDSGIYIIHLYNDSLQAQAQLIKK